MPMAIASNGWNSMDTAPTDGTTVLVAFRRGTNQWIALVSWCGGQSVHPKEGAGFHWEVPGVEAYSDALAVAWQWQPTFPHYMRTVAEKNFRPGDNLPERSIPTPNN